LFDENSWLSTVCLSLCQDSIRRWNHFAFMRIAITFVQLLSFMGDRHNCVQEMVFLFTCVQSECSAVEVACLAQNIRHSSASVRSHLVVLRRL